MTEKEMAELLDCSKFSEWEDEIRLLVTEVRRLRGLIVEADEADDADAIYLGPDLIFEAEAIRAEEKP